MDRVNNRGAADKNTTAGSPFHSKRIQAGLSTQISIRVVDKGTEYVIGAVQSLDYKQSRSLSEYTEIGTDGLIGIAPQKATTYSISIKRIVFDFQRLPQALQLEYRHIHSQRRPFDIVVVDYNSYLGTAATPAGTVDEQDSMSGAQITDDSEIKANKTTFKNCWFDGMNYSYSSSDYQITEDATLKCEHVYDSTPANTIAGPTDAIEAAATTDSNGSIMSAFNRDT